MPEENNILESELEIINSLGLHARPASLLVQLALKFDSEIFVEKDGETVNGKSLMGLLMLSAGCGSFVKVSVKGCDSSEAIAAIEDLINSKFDEE